MTPRCGRRLGVDVGNVRIGVALSDPSGVLATPLVTLKRDMRYGTDLDALAALVVEHEVVEVVVGLPRTLAGRHGPAACAAQEYARTLAERL
ncbi:MAG: Holliday junction resolvase RuvX, partial [Actinobacteria bacterium]|nr:Holliday junction resolvase RuvX [Actinomycetota bacterium]